MNAGWKRSLVVTILVAPLLAACADAPTEPDQSRQPKFARQFYFGSEQVEVVTRQYVVAGARTSRTIGRNGGYIWANGVLLVIPSGALDLNVEITLTVPEGNQLGVELEPHGLTFRRPAYLAFPLDGTDYDDDDNDDDATGKLSGAYHLGGATAALITPRELMPVHMMNGLAAFGVWHFSSYAITKKSKGLILVGG